MIWLMLVILGATLVYWKLSKIYNYWPEKGVKQRKQTYIMGDSKGMLLRKESVYDAVINMYNAFPNERYMGIYQMLLPTLLIRDPELLKRVTVKDFDHFLNHRAFIPDGVDPLWNKNLFALKDTQWRDMRSTLSPSFTSSKMKMIFSLISECADGFLNHFLKVRGNQVLEMKDMFTRYTNDVIASVAFGIQVDSINEKDNLFYTMGKRATTFGAAASFKFFMYVLTPSLCKLFGISFFPSDVTYFFLKVIRETIETRESEGIVRPDMLNLLLEARKGQKNPETETNGSLDTGFATVEETNTNAEYKPPKQELTDFDIAAQALVFFFAGFESVATLMAFAAYELTLNQDVQKKLQKEIDDTLDECKGKLTYEALMKMKYMDMVVTETLRKWPSAVASDRVCSKAYTIEPAVPNEKPVYLNPGDLIWIPIAGIHMDPKYYPNPEKFDPERFNDEHKANIKPYTYMPFGLGPRNCIGSRFALMETKTILFYFLSKFNMCTCAKTEIPIKLNTKAIQLRTENGIWLELQPRVK